jgi:hypothetical protein
MAKVEGRRNDETAEPKLERAGAEKWTLLAVIAIAVAAVIGLLLLAGGG